MEKMSVANVKNLVNPSVLTVNPYIPGKPISELKREFGLRRISKLASNENPLGCSELAKTAMQNALIDVARYPDGNTFDLRSALAQFWQVSAEQILLGNGSNEVLELIARTFAKQGDEVVFSQYAFAVYAISAQIVGATPVQVPAKAYGHDLEAMLSAITDKTKIVYIANPNNPTGTVFNQQAWDNFIAKVPENVLVVVDEAYIEYAKALMGNDYPNVMKDLQTYPNLMITRTFSKAYGLASLRIGALIANPEVIALIHRIREPFNVNQMAQVAAMAALQDQDFIEQSVAINQQGMAQICRFLEDNSIDYIPSFGNFVTANFGAKAAQVNQKLLEKGVIVRPQGGYGMAEFLRVSIGSESENAHFMEALSEILAE